MPSTYTPGLQRLRSGSAYCVKIARELQDLPAGPARAAKATALLVAWERERVAGREAPRMLILLAVRDVVRENTAAA